MENISPFKVSEASCQIMSPSAVEVVYVIVLVIMKLNKNELYVDSSKSLKYSSIPNTFPRSFVVHNFQCFIFCSIESVVEFHPVIHFL